MKPGIIAVPLMIMMACRTNDVVPAEPASDSYFTSEAILLKQETLEGINHTASGIAHLYEHKGKKGDLL